MESLKPLELIHSQCPNFKWYEVWKSSTANRLDLSNITSDSAVINNVRNLVVNVLQPLREDLGSIKPQSWYRGEALERWLCRDAYINWCAGRKIKPTEKTWQKYFKRKSHPKGQAVDIEVSVMSNDDLFEHIRKHYQFDQLIREYRVKGIPDSGWVHVSWAGAGNRNQVVKIN